MGRKGTDMESFQVWRLDEMDVIEGERRRLFRAVAVCDIARLGVRAGEKGGYIAKEARVAPGVWCGVGTTFEGGTFRGGTFRGGDFWGGTFEGGTFRGGTFEGGDFEGGTFRGGTFEGGDFWGGDFWGGDFRGGDFWGGDFRGGDFRGGGLTASRSDGYIFTFNRKEGQPAVAAGCRYFTFTEAREHWRNTREGTQLGEESFAILDHLERMARCQGIWEGDGA